MGKKMGARQSLSENTGIWQAFWALVIINVFAIITIIWGFSVVLLLLCALLALIGFIVIGILSARLTTEAIQGDIQQNVATLMLQIQPACDEVFVREVERVTGPVIEGVENDFSQSLEWLWEDMDSFLQKLKEGLEEIRSTVKLLYGMNGTRSATLHGLEQDLVKLQQAIGTFADSRQRDQEDLDQCIDSKSEELRQAMESEKEIFYDYVKRLLAEQMKNSAEGYDPMQNFNVDKLGEQFAIIIEKSVQGRLDYFQAALIHDIENISSDIVGKMQKGALQVLTLFKDIEGLIEKLAEEYRSRDSLAIRRLLELQPRIGGLREEANELMVSLAWQDIMQEKRWIEIQERIREIRDEVMKNVETDVLEYLAKFISEEIPGLAGLTGSAQNSLLAKSILDAEVLYQVFKGEQLLDLIKDGSYVLLQYIVPVEMLMLGFVNASEQRLEKRRMMKEQIKRGTYQEIWEQVLSGAQSKNPRLAPYLQEVFPRAFLAFCNSARVKRSPTDLNQAAWMIFMDLIENRDASEDDYLLVALMICMQTLRNQYINPLRSQPLTLTDREDLELMRDCAFNSIAIMIA